MKSHPIIMVAPSVRAILEGRKTQTRRVIKPQPGYVRSVCLKTGDINYHTKEKPYGIMKHTKNPHGQVGDQLWVRETLLYFIEDDTHYTELQYRADKKQVDNDIPSGWEYGGKWIQEDYFTSHQVIPSIFMPRWASRIMLEITKIRVKRVQDISEEDACREGIHCSFENSPHEKCDLIEKFKALWDSLNAKRGYGWESNPFVWVIEFKRVK